MKSKLDALNELSKVMAKLKGEKIKSRKAVPEEVAEEEAPEPEVEELVEEDEEAAESKGTKSFSEILAEVSKGKSKKC